MQPGGGEASVLVRHTSHRQEIVEGTRAPQERSRSLRHCAQLSRPAALVQLLCHTAPDAQNRPREGIFSRDGVENPPAAQRLAQPRV